MHTRNFSRTIIVANGRTVRGPALEMLLSEAEQGGLPVIAANGGADNALQLGLQPAVVIGDMDSIQPATLADLETEGVEIIRHPAAKDETDLELALLDAVQRGAEWIRIIGGTGDRIDHTFGNVYLLRISALAGIDVRMVSAAQTLWIATPGTHRILGQTGDTLSLIPLDEDVTGIRTQDLEYPLQGETLYVGPARGISNVIVGPRPTVHFESGHLLIVHTVGRA